MEDSEPCQNSFEDQPTPLRAALKIFTSVKEIEEKTVPHVNFVQKDIDWAAIFRNDFPPDHYSVILFAFSLWSNEVKPKANQFDLIRNLTPNVRRAAFEALAIQWGIY